MGSFLSWVQSAYAPSVIVSAWGAIALSYGALHVIERIFPAERGQPYSLMLPNLKITALFMFATPFLNYMTGDSVARAVQWLDGPWLSVDGAGWLSSQPLMVRAAALVPLALLSIFTYDFFYYWFHRLQHTVPWLWHQHKLHHGDEAVNVTTSLRHHWTEEFLRAFLIAIPLTTLITTTPVEAGVLTMVLAQWGNFIHMNVRVQLGPLTRVFCGPQVHRIHHSIEERHRNRNFAAFFPIWDLLFGTYYHPERDEFPRTGVAGEPSDPGMTRIIAGPFIAWGRSVKKLGARTRLVHSSESGANH